MFTQEMGLKLTPSTQHTPLLLHISDKNKLSSVHFSLSSVFDLCAVCKMQKKVQNLDLRSLGKLKAIRGRFIEDKYWDIYELAA